VSEPIKLVPKKTKWYELDRLVPYRDPMGLVGFLLIVACVSAFSWRGGLGVAGVGLLALSYLMARGMKHVPAPKPEHKPHAHL
jgi:hypothetical protein